MEQLIPGSISYKRLSNVVRYYLENDGECPYVEFKHNNADPDKIGEYVSALSNEARLNDKDFGYLIWGIEDGSRNIVGTTFDPTMKKQGNLELETWLLQLIEPKTVRVSFFGLEMEGKRVVVMEVDAAKNMPTSFHGREAIRNGSSNKPLRDFPSKEAKLWSSFAMTEAEREVARGGLTKEDVLRLLDIDSFYRLGKLASPRNMDEALEYFVHKGLLKEDCGLYGITVAAALLLARDLDDFPLLVSKKLRVIEYASDTLTAAKGERFFDKGYLPCFDDIEAYVIGLLPREERYSSGRREEVTLFPKGALREALGNLIAHQDLTAPGFGPSIGIHPHYVEYANPGSFKGDIRRAMDMLPLTRNPLIVEFLHLAHICESRGMGIDIMEEWMGVEKLPSPLLLSSNGATRLLFRHYDKLTDWTNVDLMNTIYSFVSYNYIAMRETGNADIRQRLGIKAENAAAASRLITSAIQEGWIKVADETVGVKARKYVPFWA